MATGLLLLLALTPLEVAGQAPPLSSEEQALLDRVNDYRIQNGLNPLSISASLTGAARLMSQDMANEDYFSHTDSLGRSPFERMALSGYDCEAYNTWCGENLAAGVASGGETFELWRNSPGHNGNMLNPNYVVAGIAAAFNQDSTYGWYWTLDMGGVDDSGQAPSTATPEPTPIVPTLTPSPYPTATPEPSPSATPQPSATSTPVPPAPTQTVPPPTDTAVPPTETAPPAPTVTPAPSLTVVPPTQAATAVASPPAEPSGESSGQQFGQAPPTRTDEVSSAETVLVRELEVGWNRVEVAGEARRLTEVFPMNDGSLLAVYAWDQGDRVWQRYLPGVDFPGVNTLTKVGANQTIWILTTRRAVLRLPA